PDAKKEPDGEIQLGFVPVKVRNSAWRAVDPDWEWLRKYLTLVSMQQLIDGEPKTVGKTELIAHIDKERAGVSVMSTLPGERLVALKLPSGVSEANLAEIQASLDRDKSGGIVVDVEEFAQSFIELDKRAVREY